MLQTAGVYVHFHVLCVALVSALFLQGALASDANCSVLAAKAQSCFRQL
jgi:hypothetical protein